MLYTVYLYLIRFFSLLPHLSLSITPSATHLSLSLCLAFSPRRLAVLARHAVLPRHLDKTSRHAVSPHCLTKPSRHADLTTPRDRDHPGSPLVTDPLPSTMATETVCRSWKVTNTEGRKKKGFVPIQFMI